MATLQSWVEQTAMQIQPFETVAEITFIQWCQQTFFSWRKDIYSGHTEKPKESPTLRNCSNQKRRWDKTLVHMINVQTVTDGISQWVTSGAENTSLILVDHGVEVTESCYRNVMLLQQLLPTVH